MNAEEAQRRVLRLVRLAASQPDSEEGRSAGGVACKLIVEHGLLILKPADLAALAAPAPTTTPPSPPTKRRRRRADPKAVSETVATAADVAVTTLDAAGRVASAVDGFRSILTSRRGFRGR